jgi:hypothetical protein
MENVKEFVMKDHIIKMVPVFLEDVLKALKIMDLVVVFHHKLKLTDVIHQLSD